MEDLSPGIDTRIRPAGTSDPDLFVRDPVQCLFNDSLDRPSVLLYMG